MRRPLNPIRCLSDTSSTSLNKIRAFKLFWPYLKTFPVRKKKIFPKKSKLASLIIKHTRNFYRRREKNKKRKFLFIFLKSSRRYSNKTKTLPKPNPTEQNKKKKKFRGKFVIDRISFVSSNWKYFISLPFLIISFYCARTVLQNFNLPSTVFD